MPCIIATSSGNDISDTMKQQLALITILVTFFSFTLQAQVDLITQSRMNGAITKIEYSPQGNYIASVNEGDNAIRVWDVRSGKIIGSLFGHESKIRALAFVPSGDRIISADKSGTIISWDLNTWIPLDSSSAGEEINCLRVINQHQFVFGTAKGNLVYKNISDLKTTQSIACGKSEISDLTVHPNHTQLAISVKGKELQIYDAGGKKLHVIPCKDPIHSLLYGSDAQLITAGAEGKLALWDINSKKKTAEISAHGGPINTMAIRKDFSYLATAGSDKSLKIWKAGDLSVEKIIEESAGTPIGALSFSPDGTSLATSGFKKNMITGIAKSENTIRIFNLNTGKVYKELKGSVKPVITFSFFPNDNKIAILHEDQELSFWDFDLGEKTGSFTLPDAKREYYPSADKVKDNAVGTINSGVNTAQDIMNGNFQLNKKKTAKTVGLATQKNLDKIIDFDPVILFSSKGNFMVTQLPKDEIRVYQIIDGKPVYRFYLKHRLQKVNAIAISPDENFVVCGGIGDEYVTVCDLKTGEFSGSFYYNIPNQTAAISEILDVSFSPDGKLFAAVFNTGKLFVSDFGKRSVIFENLLPVNLSALQGGFVNFSRDAKYILYNSVDGFRKLSIAGFTDEIAASIHLKGRILPMYDPQDFAVSKTKDGISVFNILNGNTVDIPCSTREITNVGISSGGRIAISFKSGEIRIINVENGKNIATMVTEGDNAIIKTSDNFYKVNKEGYSLVTFRVGKNAYPFEQFDLFFNRPSRVLEALGSSNKNLVKLYESAYEKRLQKNGQQSQILSISNLPGIEITNRAEIGLSTKEKSIRIAVKAQASHSKITGLQFRVNNVPVFGIQGIRFAARNSIDTTVVIPLLSGTNEIRVASYAADGTESLNEAFQIEADYKASSNLYLVTIGTSAYKDKKFSLKYAAKDAKDMAAAFGASGGFTSVKTKSLTDGEVTKKNILALKDFLMQADVNDVVMIFVAGHGVLDKNFNYFYAPYTMDFNNPAKEGISYDLLESLLNGLKAIRKILIMDTCHSGELEKEDVQGSTSNNANVESGDVEFRAVGEGAEYKDAQMAGASKMVKELFADLRKGTGAIAISSAGGTEYAMESETWKNGLFTYCLLEGLKSKKADLNSDGTITLQEVQKYVVEQVSNISSGKQVPTTRVDNFMLDFPLWK